MKIIKSEGLSDGEKKVNKLCEKSFLSLWNWPNLYKSDKGELCGNLIIFGKIIIIISEKTKDFNYEQNMDKIDTIWNRWKKS